MGPTPIRPVMRLSRQECTEGAYSVHTFGQHTFLEALNTSATPKEGIGISGSVSHPGVGDCINMRVTENSTKTVFKLSMVYAYNDINVCGDFNCVLAHSERLGGSSSDTEIAEFQQCLTKCELVDSPAMGSLFTWNNKQEPATRVYSRLDRVLINEEWSTHMADMCAHFLPEGVFDHTPCVIKSRRQLTTHNKPFMYYNMWGKAANYTNALTTWWDIGLQKEIAAQKEYKELQAACTQFLSQKAKAAWIKDGDSNSKYFHGVIKSKFLRNQVLMIKDIHGIEFDDPHGIQEAFLNYYKDLLGTTKETVPVNVAIVRKGKVCEPRHWEILQQPVTAQEVKDAIFSIPDHKAPGHDGYSSAFFKDS
ncbi:uncharacterized protein LOC141601660 [Silene latifolia]|uniref:uncharacterized protein LOC141601660 n=1 Tax=Silene latifolia TaxID=37657 RepID=UPI003D78451F